jgi:hypothetical protein
MPLRDVSRLHVPGCVRRCLQSGRVCDSFVVFPGENERRRAQCDDAGREPERPGERFAAAEKGDAHVASLNEKIIVQII